MASGLEMISPCFPSLFLPIASIATLGKNVSALAGSASKAAIHLNLSERNNLADVTAKSGTQATAASLFGTLVGSLIGFTSQDYLTSVAAFTGLSVFQLYGCYKGLTYIDLNSLNPQRLDIILQKYIESNQIFDPKEVSKFEKFLVPYKMKELIIGKFPKSYEQNVSGITDIKDMLVGGGEDGKKYMILKEFNTFYLIYEELASNSDIINGYINARSLS